MGKPTGFLEYERETSIEIAPEERIKNFNEFHIPLSLEEQKIQAARCMDCGVPFCQAGMMIGSMASGCPLNNLIPEWNDMIYNDNWQVSGRSEITDFEEVVRLDNEYIMNFSISLDIKILIKTVFTVLKRKGSV